MRQGLASEVPLPTRLVSNEEFPPLPQTAAQRAGRGSDPRRGGAPGAAARAEPPRLPAHERRDGDVAARHERGVRPLLRRAAGRGGRSRPRSRSATGDAVLHLRRAAPLRRRRLRPEQRGGARARARSASRRCSGCARSSRRLNPKLAADRGTLADLVVGEHGQGGVPRQRDGDRAHLDAARALSAGGGGAAEGDDPHPRRDQPGHAVAPHARPRPRHAAARPGRPRLHGPCRRPRSRSTPGRPTPAPRPRASTAAGSSTTRRSPTRCSSGRASSACERFCVHKGLPLGPVADYNHPRDLIKAARDFPDIDFLALPRGAADRAARRASPRDVPWTTEFCQMKKKEPGLRNIYMELGSTFGQLVTTNPTACAHLLGQVIDAFGADHVLWGTDSIWYGTPQWQIEAFRRFEIPPALVEKHGYAPLTRAGEGADLRAQRRPRLRRRRERQAQRDPEGLPEPDQDGLSRRGRRRPATAGTAGSPARSGGQVLHSLTLCREMSKT